MYKPNEFLHFSVLLYCLLEAQSIVYGLASENLLTGDHVHTFYEAYNVIMHSAVNVVFLGLL